MAEKELFNGTERTTIEDSENLSFRGVGEEGSRVISWANFKTLLKTLFVSLTGAQSIAGIKTFLSSPIVPDPTTNLQAVNLRTLNEVVGTESFQSQIDLSVITDSDPGSGKLRFNHATQSSVTSIYVSDDEYGEGNISDIIKQLNTGSSISIKGKGSRSKWVNYKLVSVTVNTAYVTIEVSIDSKGADFESDDVCNLIFLTLGLENQLTDEEVLRLQSFPDLPETPTNKYLRDDGTWSDVNAGIVDISTNLYASETDSDITGYKESSYDIDVASTAVAIASVTADVIAYGEKYLYPLEFGETQIDSGQWELHLYGYVSSAVGVTQAVLRVFVYEDDGTETELFVAYSDEIDNIVAGSIYVDTSALTFTINATDRLGYQIGIITTTNPSKTLNYTKGDETATHLNAPIKARHSGLRQKNEELAYQHVDTTTLKTTPIDADSVSLFDSITSTIKLVTNTNFKAFLKTYFDTLYKVYDLPIALSDETTDLGTTNDVGLFITRAQTMNKAYAAVNVAPVGSSITVDILKNYIVIATITILTGERYGETSTISDPNLVVTDWITYDTTQIGASTAGAGLKTYALTTRV